MSPQDSKHIEVVVEVVVVVVVSKTKTYQNGNYVFLQ
jgi:hypothetical protein